MKKGKLKKILAIALTVALGVTTLVACGEKDTASGQELIHNLGVEVKTIDPTLNNAVDGSTVIVNAFEGLYRVDVNNKAIPGVAKDHTISEDGKVYTFNLRDDAKWSDGQAVEAEDFKYSWTRALDPATAAEYAFQLYYIEGGREFNEGTGKAEDLGIKVIDEKTLEVTLVNPTAYFLELTSFPTLMPLRKDIVEGNSEKWILNPETYISNGPFKLIEYNMKDSYVFEKNDTYWRKDEVKLSKLTFKMLADETSAYAAVKNGEMHMSDKLPIAEIESGKTEGLVKIYPQLRTEFYAFNIGNNTDKLDPKVKEVLADKKIRKALSSAIDRKALVEKVTKGGEIPAYSFVPVGVPGGEAGKEFSDKKYWDESKADIEQAKTLLKEAGYENGEGLPTLELLYNVDETNKLVAEAIQQMWAEIGVKVELANQEWAVLLDSRKQGNFEITKHGWTGDYVDPMTFLDMWMTGLGNNDVKFESSEYDALINKAMGESDSVKRSEYLRQAEDIILEELPIMPLYYKTAVKAVSTSVKDVIVSPLGQVYFDGASIQE